MIKVEDKKDIIQENANIIAELFSGNDVEQLLSGMDENDINNTLAIINDYRDDE